MEQVTASNEVVVSRLFMALHGYFGNQFHDKYRTGQTRADGLDAGVENAKKVWARELARFDPDTIAKALAALRDRGAKFPPSLPEFVELCNAHRPPLVLKPQLQDRTQPSPEAKAKFDEALARLKMRRSEGMGGLLANVAKAISLGGGGDEARELRRLEEEVIRRAR